MTNHAQITTWNINALFKPFFSLPFEIWLSFNDVIYHFLSGNYVKMCATFRWPPSWLECLMPSLGPRPPPALCFLVAFQPRSSSFFSLYCVPFSHILWVSFQGSYIVLVRQAQTHPCHIPRTESPYYWLMNHSPVGPLKKYIYFPTSCCCLSNTDTLASLTHSPGFPFHWPA